MDLRVFGSTHPYAGTLPYASGFRVITTASGFDTAHFASCRAIYIEAKAGGGGGFIDLELSDAPGQHARIEHLNGDQVMPFSCTAVHSGDVSSIFVLY